MRLCPTGHRGATWPWIWAIFAALYLLGIGTCHGTEVSSAPLGLPTTAQQSRSSGSLLARLPRGGARGSQGEGSPKEPTGARSLKPRDSYHLARKSFHFLTVSAFAVAYAGSARPKADFVRAMAVLDVTVLGVELVRLRVPAVNRAMLWTLGSFMRVHELKKFSGIMYCLAGLGVSAWLFPKHVAILGMLQLAMGDPLAALAGHATRHIRWSRTPTGKGVLGSLAAALGLGLANFRALSLASFRGPAGPGAGRVAAAAALVAAWAAAVELAVPCPQKTLPTDAFPLALDDNFVLPVLAALGTAVVWRALGLPWECDLRPRVLW